MEKAVINVPVATVWTTPESIRETDTKAISGEADVGRWIRSMDDSLKLDLHTHNRVQTQVLFGEEVLITNTAEGWSKVHIPAQMTSKHPLGYPGWIPSAQLQPWQGDRPGKPVIVSNKSADLIEEQAGIRKPLSFGTKLIVMKEQGNESIVQTPTGTAVMSTADLTMAGDYTITADFVASGERFIGLDYLWGGASSFGYDCSGFTYSMCRAHGILLPRDADDQSRQGMEVGLSSIRKGDLLFFSKEEAKSRVHHVGFYYGDGKMLHAPMTGKKIEIIDLAGTVYEKELCAARRFGAEE
ncbi:MAG: NlpC/P60 family protein [Bacillus sp. (in: firmicutes)]